MFVWRANDWLTWTTSAGPTNVAQWYCTTSGSGLTYSDAITTFPNNGATNGPLNDPTFYYFGNSWTASAMFQYLSSIAQFYTRYVVRGLKVTMRYEPVHSNVGDTSDLAMFMGYWPQDQAQNTSLLTSQFAEQLKMVPRFKMKFMKARVSATANEVQTMQLSRYFDFKKINRLFKQDPYQYGQQISSIGQFTTLAAATNYVGGLAMGMCSKSGASLEASATLGRIWFQFEPHIELYERRVLPND